MKSRKNRLAVIVDILTHNIIGCQDELSKQLAVRGYIVTQATLSRDLKKLRTTKIANDLGGYRYVVTSPEANPATAETVVEPVTFQSALHPAAKSIRISGNTIVIKTRTGYASGIAYDIDTLDNPAILGTIPGADTVFAVVDENVSREEIFNIFKNFLSPEVMEEARPHFFKN